MNVTDYDNRTDDYNDSLSINNFDIFLPTLILLLPCGVSFLCLISLMVYTSIKPLFNGNYLEKILYPTYPVRCIITGPSECGESVFLTTLILNIIDEYNKNHIYTPSLHQDIYQKLIKCFSNYIPIHVRPNILNEEDIDTVVDEIVNNKDFEKSDAEIETFESIEILKIPQEYVDGDIILLDDINENELNDPRVQAKFKRSRHINLSIFIISQDYYELPKRTIRANGKIYHIFKPNSFRDVQNIYHDKASMDMTRNEFKNFISVCSNEKYQPHTIDMTIDRYQGLYRLGLNLIFVPNSCPF